MRKKSDFSDVNNNGIFECSVSKTEQEKTNRMIPREKYIQIVTEATGKEKKEVAAGYEAMMRKVSTMAKKFDDVPTAYLTISITVDELAKHWNEYSDDFKSRQCKKISTPKYADDFRAYMDAYASDF